MKSRNARTIMITKKIQREQEEINDLSSRYIFLFQYFVFDFHMAPLMLFDKIITLTVSRIPSMFMIIQFPEWNKCYVNYSEIFMFGINKYTTH